MRPIILLIILFVASINTFAKIEKTSPLVKEWEIGTYGFDSYWHADFSVDTKGNVYIFEPYKHYGHPDNCSDYKLSKIDKNGKLVWQIEVYHWYRNHSAHNDELELDPFGNIFFWKLDTLMKYDSDGNFVWKKNLLNYKRYYYYDWYSFEIDSKGNIIYYDFVDTQPRNYFLTKIDNDGNLIWKVPINYFNTYNNEIMIDSNDNIAVYSNKIDTLFQIITYSGTNGEILSTSKNFSKFIFDAKFDNYDNICFVEYVAHGFSCYFNKMSGDGNIMFRKLLDTNPTYYYSNTGNYNDDDNDFCFDNNNSAYIPVGITPEGTSADTLYAYNANFNPSIIKIDKNGRRMWKFTDPGPKNKFFTHIIFSPPNTLYVLGNSEIKAGNSSYNHQNKLCKYYIDTIDMIITDYQVENEIDTLDLGKICLGDTKTGYAAVKNFSDFGLELKPPVFTDSEHFTGEYMRGDSLFWNDTLGVRIHIAPDKTGPIETMMYIYCNEDDAVMDSLLIKALVVEPGMEISNDIDFGYVKFGKRPEKTFTIRNTGTSDLYISDLNEFDLPFRITETDPAIPAVLIPGDSMIVTMTVQGTAEEEYFDTLSVETKKIGEACPIDGFVNMHTITLRYELAANDIDYGFVADCKTPQDTVRLVNCGAAPVKLIDEGYLNNKDDFEIVSATPSGTVLNFLDTAFYLIRFTPKAPDGLKTGELRIKTDHPEEGFRTVRLRGETESVNLTAENISFGNVGINRDSTLKCVLTNHNGFDLLISSIIENHAWLEILPQSFTIPVGEDFEIDVKINLADAIEYSAWPQIIIQGPCPDTVAFRIDATGIKSSVEVTPLCNYNETEFCQSKTMDIEIKNTGKLPISLLSGEIQGADKELFSFEDNYENIEILPGESIIEKVIFTPESSINGPKTAQARNIILIDMVEVEFITELQGERYTILYDIPEFVSVSARISENATEQIELKNTAEYDFTIEEINLENAAEFSITPDLAGRKINAGLSEMLTVSLFSNIAGDYEDKIYLKFAGPFCEYRDTIEISGIVKHENLIFFPETIGTIGDPDFRIPLMLNLNSTEDISGLSYTAEISLDAYLYDLTGIDNANILSNKISGRERILSISGENISLSKGEQAIAELSGGLLLSDIRECDLKINSFEWDSPYIDNSTQNGLLKVEEICIGDLRAISTFAIPGITACPNPTTGQIEINLSGVISNPQSLKIYDSQGKLLRELPINSKDKIKINIQDLSSGLYFLILKTASGVYYDKVVVE